MFGTIIAEAVKGCQGRNPPFWYSGLLGGTIGRSGRSGSGREERGVGTGRLQKVN